MEGVSKALPFTMEAVLPLVLLPIDVEGRAFIGVSVASKRSVGILFLVDLRTPVDGGGMDGVCRALVLGTAAAPLFLVDFMPRFTYVHEHIKVTVSIVIHKWTLLACEATLSATCSMASLRALLSTDEEATESVVDDDDGSLCPARAAASNSS